MEKRECIPGRYNRCQRIPIGIRTGYRWHEIQTFQTIDVCQNRFSFCIGVKILENAHIGRGDIHAAEFHAVYENPDIFRSAYRQAFCTGRRIIVQCSIALIAFRGDCPAERIRQVHFTVQGADFITDKRRNRIKHGFKPGEIRDCDVTFHNIAV